MTEKMDRRTARTKRALHGALMTLIVRKGYDAITVQDIIDEADIGRSTFYTHCTGKEDLLRSGFQMLHAELEAQRTAARRDAARGGVLGFSLAMFEHASRYKPIYRALVGGRGGVITITEIRRVLTEVVKRELSGTEEDETLPRDLRIRFVVGTLLTTLTWWLDRRPTLAPSEVDLVFRHLVLSGIGRVRPASRQA